MRSTRTFRKFGGVLLNLTLALRDAQGAHDGGAPVRLGISRESTDQRSRAARASLLDGSDQLIGLVGGDVPVSQVLYARDLNVYASLWRTTVSASVSSFTP